MSRRAIPEAGCLTFDPAIRAGRHQPGWGGSVTASMASMANHRIGPGDSDGSAATRCPIRADGPWHYVDVPIDEPRYDRRFSGPESTKGCIVDKQIEHLNVLGDPDRPVEERRVALRFVVHLVGDLHQPLHVGDNHDRGGNRTQVRFYNRGTNMHRLWDADLIERSGQTPDEWLAALIAMDTPQARVAASVGDIEDWATESLLAAQRAYQDPGTGMRIRPGAKLADAYVEASRPVVRERLDRAGIRLATLLNEGWPKD